MDIIASPLGPLAIHTHQNKITRIEFLTDPSAITTPASHMAEEALHAYFTNPAQPITAALEPQGTPFQRAVWQALTEIPVGTTVHYDTLAKQLKTSPRAIGNACRRNPIPILIPCHRVVAKQHVGGYAGATEGRLLDIKKWLLQHEAL